MHDTASSRSMPNDRNLAYEPVVGFQSAKAAQIAAFFVSESGGQIDKLKLAKLQYLAEREFLGRHGRPMVYDELYSLPNGPICSNSLNGIDGKLGNRPEWSCIKPHGKKDIYGSKAISRGELDEVSDADYDVLTSVWKKFGSKRASELVNYTHDPRNCPEYTEVEGARIRISYEEILTALGNVRAVELSKQIEDQRRLELSFRE